MLPLFKSHYSIGKSILTLNEPKELDDGGPDSIFEILLDNSLSDLILVEDSPTGFLQARKISFDNDINLIFGLRLNITCLTEDSNHKVIVFSKNDKGCKKLNLIYSEFFSDVSGVGNYDILKKLWNEDDLLLAIPFYDSFLYQNTLSFSNCLPDFEFANPLFLIEDNKLPTDELLKQVVIDYCGSYDYEYSLSKSIFYKKRTDIESFQTYKCICNRNFGRKQSLSNPGFDGLGSREFCFESWKELN
jgi:hypothetical protein